MPEDLLFTLGADIHCTDGICGTLKSLVINPAVDAVTHLVAEPPHQEGVGRLVPFSLVDTATLDGEIRLRCTTTEFGDLGAAEAREVVPGTAQWEIYADEPISSWPYYAPPGVMGAPGLPPDPVVSEQAVTVDTVPDQLPDEDELSSDQRVHATDGHIGHVRGIAVDPGTGRVTFVFVRIRHLLAHKTVPVPRSAVAEVDADGFHLNITTDQVRKLPQPA